MNVRTILERNVGSIVGQLIVVASDAEASSVAKDAVIKARDDEIEKLKAELAAVKPKKK